MTTEAKATGTTLTVQRAVKAFIKNNTTKADAILVAVQDHLKIESNQGEDQFKTLIDAIGAAGKEASKAAGAEDKIPSSIKQMTTTIRRVFNDEGYGVQYILNADCMYKIRQAYGKITDAAKAAKEADKTDKAENTKEDSATAKEVKLSEAMTKLLTTQNLINKEGSRVLQNELTAHIEALVKTFNSRLGNELTDAKRKQDATIAAMETEKADAAIKAAKQGPSKPAPRKRRKNGAAPSTGLLSGMFNAKPATTAPTATVN